MSEKTLIDYLEIGGELCLNMYAIDGKRSFCWGTECKDCHAQIQRKSPLLPICKYWDSRKEISDIIVTDKTIDRLRKSRPELFI